MLVPLYEPLAIDVRSPIIAAPMAFASTAELAAAVTSTGGFGFVGAGTLSTATNHYISAKLRRI